MKYATQVANPSVAEPSISEVLSQMYNSSANKMPTYDQIMNVIKGFGSAGESLGRGFVAGIPGITGDINQLGQEYLTPHLPQSVQNVLSDLPAAPTTQDYLNQIPRYSKPFGDVTANNFMEGLGTALSPDALTAAAPAARFLGNAAGERIMMGKSLVPGVPTSFVNPQIMSAVKNKGGNWLSRGVEQLDWMKKPIENVGSSRFDTAWDNANPQKIAHHISEMEKIGYAPEQITNFKNDVALNNWIDKKLRNYVRNEMGTPSDPVRELADQGILHLSQEEIPTSRGIIQQNRAEAGFPEKGFATTPLGQQWERATDYSINNRPAAAYQEHGKLEHRAKQDPWINKLERGTPVHTATLIDNGLGFEHIIDELKNSIAHNSDLPAHLRLKPETLEKMTVPHAVKHVAKVNKYRAEQMAKAAKEGLSHFPVVHEGDKGFKIHELKLPEYSEPELHFEKTPEGVRAFDKEGNRLNHPTGGYNFFSSEEAARSALSKTSPSYKEAHAKLDKALKNEGEQMGHCVGGYTDSVASGQSRIFSLRDEKGGAHATVEATPGRQTYNPALIPDDVKAQIDKKAYDETVKAGYRKDSINWLHHYTGVQIQEGEKYFKNNPMLNIQQIKGKGNGAVSDKYRTYIKDWLNKEAGKIGQAQDLDNIGVIDLKNGVVRRENIDPKIIKALESGELKRFASDEEIKHIMTRPEVKEQKMLQGFYRGYAGEPTAEGTTFVSPQKAVADYYAQKRAGQTGLTPHAEMVLADPFAGVKYGHATAGTGAQPNIITQARKLTPEQITSRTQLYKKGGRVKMNEGGTPELTPAQMREALFAESRKYQAEKAATEPRTLEQRMIDQGSLKPKVGGGGAGYVPGSRNPFNPDSPLNRKNGGKIPSIDEMRLTILRNK